MRTDAPGLLPAGAAWSSSVEVWHGGAVTGTVPVSSGRVHYLPGEDVPERLDCTVHDPGGLVDAAGQELQIITTVTSSSREWVFPNGRFVVTEAEREGNAVRVMGRGPLQKVKDHGEARARRASDSAASALSVLLGRYGIGLIVPQGMGVGPLPAHHLLGTEPFEDVTSLAALWGVTLRATPTGQVEATPIPSTQVTSPPAIEWVDGAAGILGSCVRVAERGRRANHFIVDGADGVTAEDCVTTGRLAVSTYGWVTERVSSDAVTSAQAALIARNHVLTAYLRAEWLDVTVQPDWRAEPGDPIAVTHEGVTTWGRLIAYDRPLTSLDGLSREQIGVPS